MAAFNPDLVQVSKTSEKYLSLTQGTITMSFKDFYSHFGFTHNKNFNNYSIGIKGILHQK